MTLFEDEPLTVMISSRCADEILYRGKDQPLSALRVDMKAALEKLRLHGKPLFKVWIHEDEALVPRDQTSWDTCLAKAKEADIFLVLYNGNAGWSGSNMPSRDKVGICHAEFEAAYNKNPSKVRSIQFPEIPAVPGSPDQQFQDYFKRQKVLGPQVNTGEQAIKEAKNGAVATLLGLARAGVGVRTQGSYYAGEALEWSRLDFQGRRNVTTDTVVRFLAKLGQRGKADGLDNTVLFPIAGKSVAFVCDCIPAPLSTAAARELVGQPFLRDHEFCAALPKTAGGPVHLIACQRGVTEAQALRQLGFPDAVVVSAPFGVYVADDVQKIQMVFIANCRDETATRQRVQRFLHWLEEQGEDRLLAQRAMSRRKIGDLIAKVQC